MKSKLPAGYSIKEIPDSEEYRKLWQKPGQKIFNKRSLFYSEIDVYSKKEISKFKKLREEFKSQNRYSINLALFYKNKFVGWSWGFQETSTVFYMCTSAILPAHRGKGLYTILAREMIKRATQKGFQRIYSRHVMTNNDILIAKMKLGFKITTFELSEAFGTLVHLTYYPSKISNEILDFRAGYERPNKKIKKIFRF